MPEIKPLKLILSCALVFFVLCMLPPDYMPTALAFEDNGEAPIIMPLANETTALVLYNTLSALSSTSDVALNGNTVTITGNVTITDSDPIPISVPYGVTLDVAVGGSLTVINNADPDPVISVSGSLTVSGGEVVLENGANNTNAFCIFVVHTFKISAGTVTLKNNEDAGHAIAMSSYGILTVEGGTVSVESSKGDCILIESNSKLNISGGTIRLLNTGGTGILVRSGDTLTGKEVEVSGGSIEIGNTGGTGICLVSSISWDEQEMEVSGGSITVANTDGTGIMFTTATGAKEGKIKVSGGSITVSNSNAGSMGILIDSDYSMEISGGTVTVSNTGGYGLNIIDTTITLNASQASSDIALTFNGTANPLIVYSGSINGINGSTYKAKIHIGGVSPSAQSFYDASGTLQSEATINTTYTWDNYLTGWIAPLFPVNNSGAAETVTYSGSAIDLTGVLGLFIIDSNAGVCTYSNESTGSPTGTGSINGNLLTVTKAGTFTIGLVTASTPTHEAGAKVVAMLTVSKGNQSAPPAPISTGKTETSVTLTANSDMEFSKDGLSWQNSNMFNGLTPDTVYNFYQRLKATDLYNESAASQALSVKTDMSTLTYTISFNAGGGLGSMSSATVGSGLPYIIPANAFSRSGYSFNGWIDQNGTFYAAGATIASVSSNIALTAQWLQNQAGNTSGSNSKSDSTPVSKVDLDVNGTISSTATLSGNTVTAVVPVSSVNISVNKLLKELTTTVDKAQVIAVKLIGAPNSLTKVSFGMQITSIANIVEKTDASLSINAGNLGMLTFNKDALTAIASVGADSVNISVRKIDEANYDYSVIVDGKTKSDLTNGFVRIGIPYNPLPHEDINALVAYSMDGNGESAIIPNCKYIADTKEVTFAVNRFSSYFVGYNMIEFTDVPKNHWGRTAVTQAAARELVGGVGGGKYDPDRAVTRAEFVQMMQNVLLLPLGKTVDYSDVKKDVWYYRAVVSFRSAGLLKGLLTGDNLFNPDQPVSRKEMAVILSNICVMYGQTQFSDLSGDYVDSADINAEYLNAVWSTVTAGLMNSTGTTQDGLKIFEPDSTATRVQAAQIQANLLALISGN